MKTLTKEQFAKVMSIICVDGKKIEWSVTHIGNGETSDLFGGNFSYPMDAGYYLTIYSHDAVYWDLGMELSEFIEGLVDTTELLIMPINADDTVFVLPISED